MADEASRPDESEPLVAPNGRLTDEGAQVALDWISARWADPKECPFHPGATTWQIDRAIGSFPGYQTAGFANFTFPVVLVKCGVCGFQVPINAIQMGVIPPDPPEEKSVSTAGEES